MLTVHTLPSLRSPALLCGFSGWADAGFAASQAVRYILQKRENERIAEFNPDSIYAYTTTRPSGVFASPGRRVLRWPSLAWHAVPVPESPRDLVILVGPEPDLRWQECLEKAAAFIEQLGISQVITLGAFLAQVHYAAPPFLMGLASNEEMRERLQSLSVRETDYEGPTGFASGVASAAAEKGIPTVSLWTAAPSYLANMANPKLSAALLATSEQLLGQELWRQELEAAGREMERNIDEAVRARPELAKLFPHILGQEIQPSAEQLSAENSVEFGDFPSAEEVLKDLEEHLRRLREQRSDDAPPN
ncbi:MAG: PAC2 family protein [Chloroflexota bacterium]|nr:MAG: PAC2 family protein [Chloroflexota bacterium]